MRACRVGRGVAACAVVVLLAAGVRAEPAATPEYSAWRKAGRGLAALTTGFLEVPGRMTQEARERGILPGMGVGLVKGLGALAPRHLAGLYELITWPLPVPRRYEPLIRPEFPWQGFEAPPPPER